MFQGSKRRRWKHGLVERTRDGDTGTMDWRFCWLFLVLGLSTLEAQTDAGLAGVFTDVLGGRVTASGEVYDPLALTAGHPSLRFGIRLAVTNPANGRVVTVRVNDRGPSPEGRVVNLSRAAADALGVITGDRVEIRALRVDEAAVTKLAPAPPAPAPEPAPAVFVPTPPPSTYLQMGAFRTEANAQKLALSLARQGYEPQIRKQGSLLRVYLTLLESEAPAWVERLTSLGRKGFFQVSREPAGSLVKLSTE